MSALNWPDQHFIAAAYRVYAEKLRSQLEPQFNGEIIAVEPESGEYVLGRTFRDACTACRTKFGKKWTHMFRVGGGGAVKLGMAGARFRPARARPDGVGEAPR